MRLDGEVLHETDHLPRAHSGRRRRTQNTYALPPDAILCMSSLVGDGVAASETDEHHRRGYAAFSSGCCFSPAVQGFSLISLRRATSRAAKYVLRLRTNL